MASAKPRQPNRIVRAGTAIFMAAVAMSAWAAGTTAGQARPDEASARSAASAYVADFLAGRYGAMWDALDPSARAGWNGLDGFAHFYRLKFAPVDVRGAEVGVQRRYGRLVRIRVSLDLIWRAGGPPGVLGLFRGMDATLTLRQTGWRILDGGPIDPAAPIIPPIALPERAIHVPILMYHHVSSAPPLAQSQVGLTVTDREFAAQLDYLAAHGFTTIKLVDLFDALYYGRPLPMRPVVLTFDDGYLDNFTDAFVLLQHHRMIGEFNIISAYPGITLGVNRYMSWRQIDQLVAAGMEVESHTIDHQDLGLLDEAQDCYELRFSRAQLAWRTQHAVQFLAYPSGEPFRSGSPEAQRRLLTLLPRFGYVGALLDQRAPSSLQSAQSPYGLNRVRVVPGESLQDFAASLSA